MSNQEITEPWATTIGPVKWVLAYKSLEMQIALVTDGVAPYVVGGMQRHSALLAQHLAKLGVQISLYHTDCGNGFASQACVLEGFPGDDKRPINSRFVAYPKRHAFPGHYIAESLAYSGRLLDEYLKGPKSDFIYAKGLTGWAFLQAKRCGTRLPVIGVNAHGYEMFQRAPDFRTALANFLFRPLFRSISKRADVVFSYGGKITDILRSVIGVQPDRIIEIPTGVDAAWIRTEIVPAHSPLRFIFLGRHERRKGIEEISHVLSRFKLDGRFLVDFIGPIPSDKQLRMDGITYHGLVTGPGDIQRLLDTGDVLLCPSYAEGMPNVIMEAMARGLAIIATNVGAVRLMVDSENGILLPRCDSELLRQAMQKMTALPATELEKLKEGSLRKVRQFTWDRVAQMTLDSISSRVN